MGEGLTGGTDAGTEREDFPRKGRSEVQNQVLGITTQVRALVLGPGSHSAFPPNSQFAQATHTTGADGLPSEDHSLDSLFPSLFSCPLRSFQAHHSYGSTVSSAKLSSSGQLKPAWSA